MKAIEVLSSIAFFLLDVTQVIYTYTPAGQRETVTDERGVTTYGYDLRDRLISVENPDGSTLTYTFS